MSQRLVDHQRKPDGWLRESAVLVRARQHSRAVPTDILHFPARVVVTPQTLPVVREELSGSRAAAPSDTAPVVLADAGVENVNAQVDELIHTGVLRRLLVHGAEVLELHDRSVVALPDVEIARLRVIIS